MTIRSMDVHWAAGFLEGEGSFSTCGAAPRVQATQVELEPLHKLVRLFGGQISPKKPAGFGKKPCHSWALTNVNAAGVMFMIFDLMSPRRKQQIERAIGLWIARGARVGERHYGSVMNDTDALAAMQRVHNGEGIVKVARDVGISHVVLMHWMRGRNKPYLRKQLIGESQYVTVHRGPDISDADALTAMRRIQLGEATRRVAASVGLDHSTLRMWMTGARRPHLLAQLQPVTGE